MSAQRVSEDTESRALAVLPASAMAVPEDQVAKVAEQIMKFAVITFDKADPSPLQVQIVARLSLAYGLDPFAGELMLYQGKPYLTYKGSVRIAENHPQFDGIEIAPANEDERKAFRCAPDDVMWVARVWRKDRKFPATGYGVVSPREYENVSAERRAHLPAYKWPNELAQKRAKQRALRDYFSMPLPGRDDEPEAAYSGPVIEGDVRQVFGEPASSIEGDQLRAVHAKIKALGVRDEEYREYLRDTFGVESSLDLKPGQAAAFLEFLEGEADRREAAAAAEHGRAAFASGELLPKDAHPAAKAAWVDALAEKANASEAEPADANPIFNGGVVPPSDKATDPGAGGEAVSNSQQVWSDPSHHEEGGDPVGGNSDTTVAPASPSETATEEERNGYAQLLQLGDTEGIDLAPYSVNFDTTERAEVQRLGADLKAKIEAKRKGAA